MLELIFNSDREIILFFRDMCASPAIVSAANLFTMIGYGAAVWMVIVIWFSARSRNFRIFLCWMIICGVIFVIGDFALKNIVQRARPFTDMPFLVIRTVVPTSYSFPSSHAAYSGAGFCFVALICRRRMVTIIAGVLAF
ncbi:MAG TPA: phosphatase PAP2 family protein, partial [Spirochaetota bacterium]|nr:phosphatase PAP2 family protein [Spirochaetota bacterium]